MNNLKPFNLEEYLTSPSKRLVTRMGLEVRIICTDKLGGYPVCALIKDDNGDEFFRSYTSDGIFYDGHNSNDDLFFAPEKKEGWINIYKTKQSRYTLGSSIYNSKEEARDAVYNSEEYVTTIKIEWEE